VRIDNPEQYQEIVDAEWEIIEKKLNNIVATGCKIILSRLAIGDLATQYFADRDIFCAGRVEEADMDRVAAATGGRIITSVNDIDATVVGTCGLFEERQIGSERFNLFTRCPLSKTVSIILRGGAKQFLEEADRSLHDSIMIVRRAVKFSTIVAGGGATEMELSRYLKAHSKTIKGKAQLIIAAYAKALEVIPRQLAENAGFDSTDILNRLRNKHSTDIEGGLWFGVDIDNETICSTYDRFVWEPSLVKINAITAATEAANLILSVDETVKAPQSEQAKKEDFGPPGKVTTRPMLPGRGGMSRRGGRR
jgi:T-complex protein 1 subunit eta